MYEILLLPGAVPPKGRAKSTVTLEHALLADAAEAERMKAYRRDRVAALKAQLEGGEK